LNCGSSFGVGLWPWSGKRFTRTHGLCRNCFEKLEAAFDDERPPKNARATLEAPSRERRRPDSFFVSAGAGI